MVDTGVYCVEPMFDPDGTHIGSCGWFLPGRDLEQVRVLARAFGWQLEPEPRCPGHRARPGLSVSNAHDQNPRGGPGRHHRPVDP